MSLFAYEIRDLSDWADIFQSTAAFTPLVRHILALHSLPQTDIVNTTPGSHAVFRVGDYLVKVYAPDSVGWDCESDFQTEISAMRFAHGRGVAVPELVAHGRVYDRYNFRYLIQAFVRGTEFGKMVFTEEEKVAVGRQMREICNKINVPCEPLNGYDFLEGSLADRDEWVGFSPEFLRSREEYVRSYPHSAPVYVHGDIHIDNAIFGDDGRVWILDFADSVNAPVEYEYAALFPGLFRMERAYFDGFFGTWDAGEVAELLTYGFCIHRFGGHIIGEWVEDRGSLRNVAELRERLKEILEGGV